MNKQEIRAWTFIKQISYSLMIIAFVLLTSCIVKNSLLTAASPSPVGETTTNYAYSALSSSNKCAVSEAASTSSFKKSIKQVVFLATVVLFSASFAKKIDYHNTIRLVNDRFKMTGPTNLWLLVCTLRL